jgi:hypothetical protein
MDVSTVLGERHRLGGASVNLGAAALDLGVPIPRFGRSGIGFAVEAANKLNS